MVSVEGRHKDAVCSERLHEGHTEAGEEVVAPALEPGVQRFAHHQHDVRAASAG